ncbi:MAG: putative acetyltransferase [Solirubrobacteraceae bacterium]|jgi:putative acetyltransferase|nr:putative acetyltransferase [Solirubrobacteraceae bacterium]
MISVVIIRREAAHDIAAIAAVTTAAFGEPGGPEPVETRLLAELRAGDAWLPALSLVAVDAADEVVGHVVCTRARIGSAAALGLGPLSVRPDRRRQGVGQALVHTVLGAADATGEPAVVLLGDPAYYARFGFRPAADRGITPPVEAWAPYFQVRALHRWDPSLRGRFTYAEPFDHL